MAPTRPAADKPASRRGRPASSSNDKVTKRRGRPPGSRNSMPSSNRSRKPDAEHRATRPNDNRNRTNQAGAKRKRAVRTTERQVPPGKKRGRPPRASNVEQNEEDLDELSFTQAGAIPTAVQGHTRTRKERTIPAKERGQLSRTGSGADDASVRQSKAQSYVQLAMRTRRIAREVIETWPHVSPPVLDQIVQTLRDAKKDIVNTQRDEQRAIAADETLGSLVRMLERRLSGSRIPPQAKDIHFNIDKLTERYAQLFQELTTARHSHQVLTEQVKVAQHLLQRDEESLERLRTNARDWKTEWKLQDKQGRTHPLLKGPERGITGDGPDDIGWRQSKAVDVSLIDTPESDLTPHLEQLRKSLESMQGNHEQVSGMDTGMVDAQVALDDVLWRNASAEQYAAL